MDANVIKSFVWMPGKWNTGDAMWHFINSLEKGGGNVMIFSLPNIDNASIQCDKMQMFDHHIAFVMDQIISLNLNNVILCGHSYGGLVITGVGDRIPERINALIYIDGYIPDNSDACWLIVSDINNELFDRRLSCKLNVHAAWEADNDSLGKGYSKCDCPQRHYLVDMFKLFSKETSIYGGGILEPPLLHQKEAMMKRLDRAPDSLPSENIKVKYPATKITAILLEVSDFKSRCSNF